MKKLLFFFVLCAAHAQALLPPLWDSVSQIKAVLSDENLKDYLDSGELIESITRNDNGYSIKTNHSTLQANLSSIPQTHIGPAVYEVHFIKE